MADEKYLKNSLQDALLAAMADFDSMQKRHREALAANSLNGLPGWCEKKQRVFLRLKQCLDQLEPAMLTDDTKFAAEFQQKMKDILHGEKNLAILAGRCSDKVKSSLRALRKGKTALRGYSVCPGAGPGPRYLSSKT